MDSHEREFNRMREEKNEIQIIWGETIETGVSMKLDRLGRPKVVLLFEKPPSGKFSTGCGASLFDLFMTKKLRYQLDMVWGHGRVMIVPLSTMNSMMAVHYLKD